MYTAILVDDEYWALIALKKQFQWAQYGFEIIGEFMDSEEALKFICEKKPDVVFTDIRMPVLSGIELLKETRKNNIHTEFVIISGYGEFVYAQEALQQGAFDYRLKPLQQQETTQILAALDKHLQSQKQFVSEMELPAIHNSGNENFLKLLEYVRNHYTSEIYLRDLADKFYLNEAYCSVLFKKNTGKNFSDYINNLRIDKAKYLLKNTSKSVEEIGKDVGFKDYYYFNKVFKKYTALTPTQFRKQE